MDNIIGLFNQLSENKSPEVQKKLTRIQKQLTALLESPDTPHQLGKALTPQQLKRNQEVSPEVAGVIEAVNEILKNGSDGNYCSFTVKELGEIRRQTNPGKKLKGAWLDAMERVFRQAGWKVVYDGPAYNESYDAYYTFTKKNS